VLNFALISVAGETITIASNSNTSPGWSAYSKINSDVVYNEKVIGQIAITWYNTAIYIYAYVFILAFLLLTVTRLFLRTVKAKQGLEIRVMERTANLREEITERKKDL